MEIIEFLAHTDHRNLKYNVGVKVKQFLKIAEKELNAKRERLRSLVEYENLQYDEELALLCRQRVADNEQKRIDWINNMRLESELAEKELLKLKQIQRERENCEELRHKLTREILLETKKSQLQQIAERKSFKQREKDVNKMWHDAMERLMIEKEKQDYFEKKLQDVIACKNQSFNLSQEANIKNLRKQANEASKKEHDADNIRAINIEKAYRERERLNNNWKKSQQYDALLDQMKENTMRLQMQKAMTKQIDEIYMDIERQKYANELEEAAKSKLENRVYHACYLAHAEEEKKKMKQMDNDLDAMLIGTGCVLEQRNKKPYGKDKR